MSDLVVRADLPIGSPERRDFFEACRLTFNEDWERARQAVARDRMADKGDLYFIRSGACVKIGRTVDIVNRLSKMQADNPETLDCLLLLRGRGHEEGEWHKRFERDRIRGEWFRWSVEIEDEIAREIVERVL